MTEHQHGKPLLWLVALFAAAIATECRGLASTSRPTNGIYIDQEGRVMNDTDRTIRATDGAGAWQAAARASVGRLLTAELTRVGVASGQRVLDLTGTVDRTRLTDMLGPSGHIDSTDATKTGLPDGPARYDFVLAGRLPHHADSLACMIALLRPGGWLILADTTPLRPPVIYTAPPAAAELITLVVHTLNTLNPHPTPSSVEGILRLLLDLGMDHVCAGSHTETSRGGGPRCAIYRDTAQHHRDHLTTGGFSPAQLDRFHHLMTDPAVVLRTHHSTMIHARKKAA